MALEIKTKQILKSLRLDHFIKRLSSFYTQSRYPSLVEMNGLLAFSLASI